MKCDFCHSPGIMWDYDCADFELPLPDERTFVSQNGWIACDPCSAIVEQNGVPVLDPDCAQRLVDSQGGSPEKWIRSVRRLQAGFLEHRNGPRKLLNDEERNA